MRSYVGSGATSAERPAAELPADEPEVRLALLEAVYLGLRHNPAVRGAYLERVLDQFSLHVAESRFSQVGSIIGAVGIAPTVQMLMPLGTTIQFGWDMRQRGSRQPDSGTIAGISALNTSLVQPPLRGAGVDAATAPLHQARLQERYAQLRLKATVAENGAPAASFPVRVDLPALSDDQKRRIRIVMTAHRAMVAEDQALRSAGD